MTAEELRGALAKHSDGVAALFEGDVKVTIIVRLLGVEDAVGFITNDDIREVETGLRRMRHGLVDGVSVGGAQ